MKFLWGRSLGAAFVGKLRDVIRNLAETIPQTFLGGGKKAGEKFLMSETVMHTVREWPLPTHPIEGTHYPPVVYWM